MPQNFCLSYNDIRKQDIARGIDYECHKNDEELSDATFTLDEQTLRQTFSSIGIADKDGDFPFKNFMKKLKDIDENTEIPGECFKKALKLFSDTYPDFTFFQSSTKSILSRGVLKNLNFICDSFVVDRVYERSDLDKRACIYIYCDIPGVGPKFYLADKQSKTFVALDKKEFEERFECYDNDLQKNNGVPPWNTEEKEVSKETNSKDVASI